VKVPLRRVNEYEWEIPSSYKNCMKVPAIIFADEFLISKMSEDLTLEQAANVGCLPGIERASYVMPDGHQGYGFPIGGVAGVRAEDGYISPGGVGYDINCLTPDTKVLDSYGAWRYIKDLRVGDSVIVGGGRPRPARVIFWFGRRESKIYIVKTKGGHVIKASGDHPVLTDKGMVPAEKLVKGMRIATYPFRGVKYERPPRILLLSEEDFNSSIAKELKKRGLLPLYTDNPKLPILIKLLGYFTGGGVFDDERTWFYGDRESLEEIRRDIQLLGYKPSKIKTRVGRIKYSGETFTNQKDGLYVSAKSFREILEKLGVPSGKKEHTLFRVPSWVKTLPLWMKRLYLAAYFGAVMSEPQTRNGYDFEQPFVSINKIKGLEENGRAFLEDIAEMLEEFGVVTHGVDREDLGDKVVLKLRISAKPKSLVNLWSKIGYVYSLTKQRLALGAIAWLKLKLEALKWREVVVEEAINAHKYGYSAGPVLLLSRKNEWANLRFAEGTIHEGILAPRVLASFPMFKEWIKENVDGDIVWDVVEDVVVRSYNGYVYDITVDDPAHNFIANGVIVSNCGVRLLRTNLSLNDVKNKIKELVDTIFRNVPSGVGSTGKLKLSFTELDKVLNEGVDWAISKGFGWEEDREFIESYGRIEYADASKVSNTAKSRGADQLGTLGAGNHFLEIQVVDKVYDEKLAKAMGIDHEGQITIMVHTGSRGLGHQVASDYLGVMERAMRRYGFTPPDRELASVPFNSKEGQDYFMAMAAAANYAFTNRQIITHWVRESVAKVFGTKPENLELRAIYDVAHNIAKLEEHEVEGKILKLVVHRKGATRAFPPGHPEIPKVYRNIGQPVLIPGSMGTASYLMVGIPEGRRTFYSAAHGAGRWLSRNEALRRSRADAVLNKLLSSGIYVKATSKETVVEEMPEAYKDVDRVALVSHKVGIAALVARMRPLGVVKG